MAVNIFQVAQINGDLFSTGNRPSLAGVYASEYPLIPDNINGNLARYTKIVGIWSSSTQNSTTGYPAGVGGDSWVQPNGFVSGGGNAAAGRPNGGYFARAVFTSDQNVNYGYIGSFVGGYGNLDFTFDINPGPTTSPSQLLAVDYEPTYGHGTAVTIANAPIPNSIANQWRDQNNLTVDATAQVTLTSSAYNRSPYTNPAMFVAQMDSATNNIGSGNLSFHVEMRPTLNQTINIIPLGFGAFSINGSRAPFRNDQYGYPLNALPDDFYAASNNRKFGSRALSIFWSRILDGSANSFAYPYYEDQTPYPGAPFANPSGPGGANNVAAADRVYSVTAIADCPTSRAPQTNQFEWIPNHAYPLNYEILDRFSHIQKVTTAGTSGANGTWPSGNGANWLNPPNFGSYGNSPDGPNTLVWTDQGYLFGPMNNNPVAAPILTAYQTDIRVRHHASLHINDEYDLFVQETKFAIFSNKSNEYPLVFVDLLDTWNSGTWAQGFRIAGASVWSESTLWQSAHAYVVGQAVLDPFGFIQVVTSISGSGTSGGSTPFTVANLPGNVTTDNPGANQVVWTNYGANKSKIFFIAENGHTAVFDSNVTNSTVTALLTAPALASGAAYGACRIQTGFAKLFAMTGSMGTNPLNSSTDLSGTPGRVGVTPYSIVPNTWGSASFPAFSARHNARSLSEIIKLRNGNFAFAVESVNVVGTTVTNKGVAPITNVSLTSNIVTISATNNYTMGQVVYLNGLTGATFLNGAAVQILSTGLGAGQFEAAFTHANYASTPDTGTATDVEWQVMLYNPTSNTWNTSQITGGGGVNFSYGEPGFGGAVNNQTDLFITYEQQINCTLHDVANTVAGNGQPVILMQCNWRDDRLFVIDGSQPLGTISTANVSYVGVTSGAITNIGEVATALTLSAVATSVGSSALYTGTITGGAANALAGYYFQVSGFTNLSNNGYFLCTASTATNLTLSNAAAIAETHAATATDYIVTITATNFFLAGQQVILSGITNANWLNGLTVTVLSQGLSNSQFTINDPTLHASYGPAGDAGTAGHYGIFPVGVPTNPTPLQIRKSVTDDRTLFWFNGVYTFVDTGADNTNPYPTVFWMVPPSWNLTKWNQTIVGGMNVIRQNTKDNNGNPTTIGQDLAFLTYVGNGQGRTYDEMYSFLGTLTDNYINVNIHGGVEVNGVQFVGECGDYGMRPQNNPQNSNIGTFVFGHFMEQGTFFLPTYFKWDGGSGTKMADNYADAVANPIPVPNTALTNVNLPYGLVAQFGQTNGSTFHQYEWFTINTAWGNTKYVRKARFVWSMFAGQTFNETQTSIPMTTVSGAGAAIPTVYLADAFGPSNITFPTSFTNPMTLLPVTSHPAGFITGQDYFGTCAIWPMVSSGVAQNNAVQCVMTVSHPDPTTILNRPNQSGQSYNASSSNASYLTAPFAFNGCPWMFNGYGMWQSTGGVGSWISIDLGAAQICRSYEFNQGANVPGNGSNFMTGWTLYGSNTATDFTNPVSPPGGSWVAINTQSAVPTSRTWAGNTGNVTPYRYYALRENAGSGNMTVGYFRLFSAVVQPTMNFSEILAFGPESMGPNDNSGSSLAPAFMRGMTFEVSTNAGVSYTPITPIWRAHHGGIWVFPRQTGVTNVRITCQSGYPYYNYQAGGWTGTAPQFGYYLGIGPFQFVDYQRSDIDSTFAARLGSSAAADGTPARGSFDSQYMGLANDSVSVSIDNTVSAASLGQNFLGQSNFNNGNMSPVYGWWTFLQIPTGTISTFLNGYVRVHPVYGFVLFGGPQPGTIPQAGGCDQIQTQAGTNMTVTYQWGRRV
jgi:hypothetical protein